MKMFVAREDGQIVSISLVGPLVIHEPTVECPHTTILSSFDGIDYFFWDGYFDGIGRDTTDEKRGMDS